MPSPSPRPCPPPTGSEEDLLRLRLDLAYDGAAFHGWAAQPGLRTVEGVLTAALETVLRIPVRLTVAGRTDTGVHAAAQVAHLDLPRPVWDRLGGRSTRTPGQALVSRLAGVLAREAIRAREGGALGAVPRGASDVVVHRGEPAPPGFDARFSALTRRYVYRVADGGPAGAPRDPRRRGQVLWLAEHLDVEAMAASARPLEGEHDFLSYCKPRQGASTVRTVRMLRWERVRTGADAGLVTLTVVADAFCHSMVRSLAGAGLAVGRGRSAPGWPGELLAARSRRPAAPVAPAHGLTLEEVVYPPAEELGAQARRARVVRRLDVAADPGDGAAAGRECCQ